MAESVELLNPAIFLGHPSGHNKCTASPIWDSWYPRLRVAVFSIFLIYYVCIIPALFLWSRKKSAKARDILSWHLFVPAVLSMILYQFLALIGDCLLNCLQIGDLKYLRVYAAVNVFRNLANVLLLGVLLFPITVTIMRSARLNTHFTKIGHAVLMAIVSAMMVVHVTFWDYNIIHSFTGQKQEDMHNGGPATYVTFYLVAAISVAVHIVRSCLERKRLGLGKLIFAPLLAMLFIAFSLIDMIVVMGWKVHVRTWTRQTSVTFGILNIFFQACVFACTALLARDLGLEEQSRTHDEKISHRDSAETGELVHGTNGI